MNWKFEEGNDLYTETTQSKYFSIIVCVNVNLERDSKEKYLLLPVGF
jgi:hypothetical protein